jgi:hypothetical protein
VHRPILHPSPCPIHAKEGHGGPRERTGVRRRPLKPEDTGKEPGMKTLILLTLLSISTPSIDEAACVRRYES